MLPLLVVIIIDREKILALSFPTKSKP